MRIYAYKNNELKLLSSVFYIHSKKNFITDIFQNKENKYLKKHASLIFVWKMLKKVCDKLKIDQKVFDL